MSYNRNKGTMWIVLNLLTNEVLSEVTPDKEKYRNSVIKDLAFNLDKYTGKYQEQAFKLVLVPKKFLLLHDARKALFECVKPTQDELLHYEFVLLGKDGEPVGSIFPRNKDEASYTKRT